MRLLDRAHQGRDAYIPALTPERSSPYTHLAWSALKSQDVRRGPVVKEELIYWTPLKERKRYLGVQSILSSLKRKIENAFIPASQRIKKKRKHGWL